MADPFVAEIRIFPFNFAPKGWAWCDGQLLPLAQNTALFSLLGTTYGGDGMSTFGLPDLQGRAALQPGQGPGLSTHYLGEVDGAETVTLLQSETPSHTHTLQHFGTGSAAVPGLSVGFGTSGAAQVYTTSSADLVSTTLPTVGGDQPHNNMQPYLTFYFCIALQGVYPPRT